MKQFQILTFSVSFFDELRSISQSRKSVKHPLLLEVVVFHRSQESSQDLARRYLRHAFFVAREKRNHLQGQRLNVLILSEITQC